MVLQVAASGGSQLIRGGLVREDPGCDDVDAVGWSLRVPRLV